MILWTECAGFKVGDLVTYRQRPASVVSISAEIVGRGYVPVMFDDDFGCTTFVPADDLDHRPPGTLKKLGAGVIICLSFLAERWLYHLHTGRRP